MRTKGEPKENRKTKIKKIKALYKNELISYIDRFNKRRLCTHNKCYKIFTK